MRRGVGGGRSLNFLRSKTQLMTAAVHEAEERPAVTYEVGSCTTEASGGKKDRRAIEMMHRYVNGAAGTD